MEFYINQKEYMNMILEYIKSEEMQKAFEATIFSKYPYSEDCRQAMIHGLIWGSLLTSRCDFYAIGEKK